MQAILQELQTDNLHMLGLGEVMTKEERAALLKKYLDVLYEKLGEVASESEELLRLTLSARDTIDLVRRIIKED